eukprot:CAMPEP_0113307630 /NCGR_PEP_ID=MMETSP0010_2-20120614/6401_1 /TAXON_ID=216773 ORGANISM="Corethron hystrix, Strain 308" /NCGR_SAMPLE_ID=MMETSP0010_2 /ASSEMBLY_ACC=CAM_ASM_000155 /LENGTH=239 /DNA_ID=CAMNT_0000162529 /DNA_START=57 /DNA_END=773 /DNA_ORIENTATION=- /assembly_acc=CAM_ASM_000155
MTTAKSIFTAAPVAKNKLLSQATASLFVRGEPLNSELTKRGNAMLSTAGSGGKLTLPDLPYDYASLEPSVSATTMQLHHTKHHQTYVNNSNDLLEKVDAALSSGDGSALIALSPAVKFNVGGHINHSHFWKNLCPASESAPPTGPLGAAIDTSFGNFDAFKAKMTAKSIAVQGSGWGWLGYNVETGLLEITSRANQDPLEATTGLKPIVGIDVWEHAYYVDYKNVRPDYVNGIWDIINW